MKNSILAALCMLINVAAAALHANEVTVTTLAGQGDFRGWFDGVGREARLARPAGLAMDSRGFLYVSDSFGTIRMISPDGVVSTYVGMPGEVGHVNGLGRTVRLGLPMGLAYDGQGGVYLADTHFGTIRHIGSGGVVTTVAGVAGDYQTVDGIGSGARFYGPTGLAIDKSGNVYVADAYAHVIRKISPQGMVMTIAGKADHMGHQNGTGEDARFAYPLGVALDSTGNLIVSDGASHTIRKVTPEGVVTTIAGYPWVPGSLNGPGSFAFFHGPAGLAVDADDNIYVADHYNHVVRKITPQGMVTVLAGAFGVSGGTDGRGMNARMTLPLEVLLDNEGNLVVSSLAVRRITLDGEVTTLAGADHGLGPDGTGPEARFVSIGGMATDSHGQMYAVDTDNHTIRKITPEGHVTTIAGVPGEWGHRDGPAQTALFSWPTDIAVDRHDNLYVTDMGNHVIRKITPAGEVTTLAGDPTGWGYRDNYPDGSVPALFDSPRHLAVDSHGNVYVTSSFRSSVRMVLPDGRVRTIAGEHFQLGAIDGDGPYARFRFPHGLAVDAQDNVFVADHGNHTVRRISPSGYVSTVAGWPGEPGDDDGIGLDARLTYPAALAFGADGNLYIVGDRLRVMDPAGRVTTVVVGDATDRARRGEPDGTGLEASLWRPRAVTVGHDGTLYFAEGESREFQRIRRVVLAIADRATIDANVGSVGKSRRLSVTLRNADEWHWQVVQRPGGSTARISDPHSRRARFAPDMPGEYLLRMHAKGPDGERISFVTLSARHHSPGTPADETSCSLRGGMSGWWLGMSAIVTAAALRRRRTISKEQV